MHLVRCFRGSQICLITIAYYTICSLQQLLKRKLVIWLRDVSVVYSRLLPSLQLWLAGCGGPESPFPHSSAPLPGGPAESPWSLIWPPENQKTTTVVMKQSFIYTFPAKARSHQNISADQSCFQARKYFFSTFFCSFIFDGEIIHRYLFPPVISWQD